MKKVLFVCLGNICRSTMAEAIMRHLVNEKKLDILVDSCGTGGYHNGEIPHLGTRKQLDMHNISYEGIFSRKIKKSDFTHFDYIVCMDNSNVYDVLLVNNTKNVTKITDYCKNFADDEVPDPYYYGNFDYVYDLIYDGCVGLIEHIKNEVN